jgi:hypothetical protein
MVDGAPLLSQACDRYCLWQCMCVDKGMGPYRMIVYDDRLLEQQTPGH